MHTIKRYANRKLYDATDRKYVTLEKLGEMIKAGEEISVVDNKTGEDLTAAAVSQILAKGAKGDIDEAASNVMVQLLRKGPGTLVDYGKRYVSMWDRALTMADEEIDKLVDRLVKDKEITRSEGSRLKKDISGRADDLKKWIGEKIDQRINDALDVMHLASREQVVTLTEKIESLTRKVQTLEKRLAQKAKEEKAREAERRRKEEMIKEAERLKKEAEKREAEERRKAEAALEAADAEDESAMGRLQASNEAERAES